MKMKKFISALAAVAVLSASLVSVSAEDVIAFESVDVAGDGSMMLKCIKSIPTKEEVGARDVQFSVTSKLLTTQELTAETNAMFANGAKSFDVYKVTAKYSNLGELANGYLSDMSGNTVTVGARAWEFNIKDATPIKKYSIKGAQFPGGTAKQAVVNGKLNSYYQATDTQNPYPVYDAGAMGDAEYIANGEVTLDVIIGIEKGTTLTLTPDQYEATFMYTVGLDAQYAAFTKPTVVIGQVEVEKDPIEIVGNRYDLDDGFAWDVQVNKYQPAKTYTATFTDVTSSEKKVNDFDFSQYVEAQADATFGFVALLKTAKTNVTLSVQ